MLSWWEKEKSSRRGLVVQTEGPVKSIYKCAQEHMVHSQKAAVQIPSFGRGFPGREPSHGKLDMEASLSDLSLMDASKENTYGLRQPAPIIKTKSPVGKHERSDSFSGTL